MLIYRETPDTSKLPYPLYISPKLDGIRCAGHDGLAKSRTLKPLPNKHLQELFSYVDIEGLDGEIIVGNPTDPDVYRNTDSFCMSHHKKLSFSYYVFDDYTNHTQGYRRRLLVDADDKVAIARQKAPDGLNITRIKTVKVNNEAQLLAEEAKFLAEGYEGAIARNPDGIYKFNRTTLKEANVFKLKRFVDGEAYIIGFEEELENTNEQKRNELGNLKRSTEQAGMVGKGRLGAFICKDIETGIEFNIGSGRGLTHDLRESLWDIRASLLGRILKYKHFPIGIKEKPRHPIWHGFRDPIDM